MGVDLQTYRSKIGTYRHSFGVDVITVVLCVNFSHGVRTVGCVLFISILLIMAGVEQNPGPWESDATSNTEDDSDNYSDALQSYEEFIKPTSIKVTGLPSGITDDYLMMFFENEKRQGGGSVREVKLNEDRNSALVDFEDSSAVETVMQKQPIIVKGTTVKVEVCDEIRPTKIEVKRLPRGVTNEILRICFEHKSMKCSGAVSGVTIDSDKHVAVVEFDKDAAAQIIMQKQPIVIFGTKVEIRVIKNNRQTKIKVTGLPSGTTDDYLMMFFEKQGGSIVKEVIVCDDGTSAIVDFEESSAVERVIQKKPIHMFKANVEVVAENIQSTRLEVTGLPTGMHVTEEILHMYLEIESRQNDNVVKNVAIDDNKSTAVVEFYEAAAVQIVVQKQPVVILGSEVTIRAFRPLPETEQHQTTKIRVTGLPKMAADEFLIMFFENENRQGGGKVRKVITDDVANSAVIDFETAAAVNTVMQKQPIIILGTKVNIEVLDEDTSTTNTRPTKIEVKQLPIHATDEILILFFENERRQGGGPVKNITIDSDKHSAIIEFETATAVDAVLKKRPIVISGTEVNVEIYDRNVSIDTKSRTTKIVVSWLPQNISSEFLVMFFENQNRYGGGPVKHAEISADKNSAMIEFEEAEAVENVMRKQPVILQGKEVQILRFVPEQDIEAVEITKIKVSRLPEHITQEFLVMFFENERRQGGGEVKSVEINEAKHYAIVEFKNTEAVEAVLTKRPIVITKMEVDVDIYSPSKGSTKIKASCLPQSTTEDFLLMFFENENRQGGGKVKHVELDSINYSAIIEFEEMKAISKILEKRPIILSGQEITIDVIDENDEPLAILVTGLPSGISEEYIIMFFENERQEGGPVKAVEFNKYRGQAIIEFESSESMKRVLQKGSCTMKGKECYVSVFKGSHTVEVRGFKVDKSAVTNILRYFKHTFQPDAENITTIRLNRQREIALVTFQTHEVVRIICAQKEHYLNQELLSINTYTQTGTVQGFEDVYDREKESIQFGQILEQLGLANKYPSKISINDVIAVSPHEAIETEKETIPLEDIPWVMLKRLMCAHGEARDITIENGDIENKLTDFDSSMSLISEIPDESENISPLDIFIVVFQCCDPMLKQILFQKLYLCKMAVPFLCKMWKKEVPMPVVSVWPLRYLAIESKDVSTEGQFKNKEVNILELSSKVLAFARFGRPHYSKSKLLNSLLTNQGCKTFFNIDCPSGMTPRHLSNGQIEMFWLPTVGDKRDKFKDAMTFLNMRGDIHEHFTSDIYDFISKFADALTIVADLQSIKKQSEDIKRILLHFSSVILIIADPLKQEDVRSIKTFQQEVTAKRKCFNLRVLSTHKGTTEQNVVDMVSTLSKYIVSQLESSKLRSIQERLAISVNTVITSDEEEPDCQHGKETAEKLLKQMKAEGNPEKWKEALTPVHCKFSKKLGRLKKQHERQKGLDEGENTDREMAKIRRDQTKAITATVRHFISILTNNSGSYVRLKLILGWLHFFIEREKRNVLPKLMQDNRHAWLKLKTLKGSKETKSGDVKRQEEIITKLEMEIDEASFSVGHFFREIGHIYEAILELNLDASKLDLPSLNKTAVVVGHLVADGHQLELIDGESFYMPFRWTQNVLEHVDNFIKSSKVMTLSVLGLQSSGKSTLLNTMFGSQFSTRTGRCTRGIHIQLVPATASESENTKSPFNFVLVVDTEGLRSSELSHMQHEHNNELATVITGLGDITMLNIMGENTSEIRDILQVIVHAFLRLKMTNRKLDTRKCCTFIHQNVTDTSASDNMITGLSKLMQTLDAMTEESAKTEGIVDITTFNQVIEFDINNQVWYLQNLWQGNPPMARVNTEYSERVVDIKCKILRKALTVENKSYKSLSDILEHAHNLWKGVLNEDFVFSFRNSIEIRAYIDMEMVVQDQLWCLECFTRDKLVERSQKGFANFDKKDSLRIVADTVIGELNNLLADEKLRTEKVISTYFETNKYKDIIIQWKATQQGRIDSKCLKLERTIKEQIEKNYEKRSVEILTVCSQEKHEEELRLRCMDEANKHKGKTLTQDQKDKLFEDIWKSFTRKLDTTTYSSGTHRKAMKNIFVDCLRITFKKDTAILKDALEKSSQLTPIQKLYKLTGSFEKAGIDENEDISLSRWLKGTEVFRFSDVMKQIATKVNTIFESLDLEIEGQCRNNDVITEMHVCQLLHELGLRIEQLTDGKNKYAFKTTFKVKIYVHVSRHVHVIFEKHNETYFRTQGVVFRLEQYKQQQKISFEAHLNNRATEDIVAQLTSNVVETFAKEWTQTTIPNKQI